MNRASRHRARGALAIAITACALACAAEPARPHLVLVTVEGLPEAGLGDVPFLRQLAEQCVRFEGIEAPGAGTIDALAVMHSGRAFAELDRGAGPPAPLGVGAPLEGSVDTWMERALPRGFETAAVVADPELGFASGLLQGAVHAIDADALVAADADAPRVHLALDAAAAFLDARLARRSEHGAVLWVHLDLSDVAAGERGALLDRALARLSGALEADPRHVFAAWFLPRADAFGRTAPLWLRVRGQQPREVTEPASAIDIAPTLAALLGVHPPPDAEPAFAPFAGRDLLAEETSP